MRRGGYRRFSALAKNIRGVLLAALLSVLAFLFAQTVFQSFYYAIPTLALVRWCWPSPPAAPCGGCSAPA